MDRDIQNRKKTNVSTAIPPTFNEKSPVNIVLDVHFDPPNSTFSEDRILAPSGCCAIKSSHTLENDQGLLAHTPQGQGFPNNFQQRDVWQPLLYSSERFYPPWYG